MEKLKNQWEPEHIKRFWDWFASNPHKSGKYFSKLVGDKIVYLLKLSHTLHGKILDYGCGSGELTNLLVNEKLLVSAIDYSKQSVNDVNQRFEKYNNFMGCRENTGFPLTFQDDYFDLIICLELIEHLDLNEVEKTLIELRRILAPNGAILITTPNNEKLEENYVYCPYCNSTFHQMQHMMSYSKADLIEIIMSQDFHPLICSEIDFRVLNEKPSLRPFRYLNPSQIINFIMDNFYIILDRLFPRNFPQTRLFQKKLTEGEKNNLFILAKKL